MDNCTDPSSAFDLDWSSCYRVSCSDYEVTVVTARKNEYHVNNKGCNFIIFSIMGFPGREIRPSDFTFQVLLDVINALKIQP
jgi:hypothetical protein